MNQTFEIKDNFYLNGEPFQIISGGIHYFRVVPEHWEDRLLKLKAMGCNTVETYVPWNLHEPQPGNFDFSGRLDLKRFLETAQKAGLYAIVRPSPYICAEWEFGGLPAWLLAEDGLRLRTSDPRYLAHVESYYHELFKILTPLQVTNGGNILLFQIENEYGYYGNDTAYLLALKAMMEREGVTVPFITSDGPWGDALEYGSVPGVLPTGNFGSKAEEQFEALSKYTHGGPLMCMEFWVGWFDSWGNEHHTGNLEESVRDLDEILKRGHVNIYMFLGGTNFGFTNGANYYEKLEPDVTSYDYDALLTEWGDITPKYERFREVIAKYRSIPEVALLPQVPKKDYGKLTCTGKVTLFDALDDLCPANGQPHAPVFSPTTQSMEQLGQNFGYVLYRSNIGPARALEKFKLDGANDRAQVFANQNPVVTLYDQELRCEIPLDLSGYGANAESDGITLDLLVENMGRVNFGQKLESQRKGIAGGVLINGHYHHGWTQYPLPLSNIGALSFSKAAAAALNQTGSACNPDGGRFAADSSKSVQPPASTALGGQTNAAGVPAFYRFELIADEPGDTFLDLAGFGKGCAFVNGFNLGRFWEVGPQKRLYVPAPLLKPGQNEIIVFETEGKAADTISLCAQPALF